MSARLIDNEYERTRFHDVPGYEDNYRFNLMGEVWSKPRRVNSPICGGSRIFPARRLRVSLVKGYPAFGVIAGGRRATVYLHRIVALLFVPNPDGKPCVNHKDGVKENFAPENLEWCTHLENMRHAYATGLAIAPTNGPGEASRAAKLNDRTVKGD